MTATEALEKWNDCATASVAGDVVFLTGNREPLSIALSRHIEPSIDETDVASPRADWQAVVKVTPAGEQVSAFYLCVE